MKFQAIKLFIITMVLSMATSAFAALSYDVSIDTSSLYSNHGFIYLQYNPVNGANSTVTLSNFYVDSDYQLGGSTSVGVVNGSAVTGDLGSTLTFANTNGINDYNHEVYEFGNVLNFSLAFSAPAAGGQAGGSSTFSLGFFRDEYGTEGSGMINPDNGTLFTIDLMNDGTTSSQILNPEATISAVPVPSAFWLLGSGLACLVGAGRRTRK